MISAVKEEKEHISLEKICRYFGASKGGYYAHVSKRAGAAAKKKEKICKVIEVEFKRADATYGSPRIAGELFDLGYSISENTVAKYMQEMELDARLKKRFRVMTTDSSHASPIADRLVKTEVKESLPTRPAQGISPT